jgi:hypothetical protein
MAAFVTDSFTDTNGTGLNAHTGELGASWIKHASATSTGHPAIQSNRLQTTEAAKNENYYSSGVPASADYSVSLEFTFNGGTAEIAGPAARMSTSVNSGYFFINYQNFTDLRLYKYVNGTLTQLGTAVNFSAAIGITYRLTIDVAGTTIAGRMQRLSDSLWINSAGAFGASQVNCISATDSAITAAGRAGWWLSNNGGTRGQIDNFSADETLVATAVTLAGPSTGTVAVASTNFTVGANGPITGTVVVTPSDAGAGGTFTPTSVSINSGSPTGTFTYTAASTGAKTISVTNDGGLSNPGSLTYTATVAALYTRVDTTDTITGQNIMVLVPSAASSNPYSSGTPTKVILYAHGSGENQTALLSDSLKLGCVQALLDAGYILAGSNANGNSWGNQAGTDAYRALERYVRANYNVRPEGVGIWSQSMGGLTGLNALAQGKFPVVGWLGTYPACNLADIYSIGTYDGAIDTAFGITGGGIYTYGNQTYGNDPALMKGFSWKHTPMRFYASSGDLVVPKATNSDVLAALVAGCCRESVVVACTGNHGHTSHFVPSEYVDFFNRCFATPVALGRPANTRTATITLTSDGTTPRANLTGLKWSWWDQATPNIAEYPTDKGSSETTDASGVLTISVRSSLVPGGIGWLVVTDSDGTTAQSPVAKAFSGPVAVS